MAILEVTDCSITMGVVIISPHYLGHNTPGCTDRVRLDTIQLMG